MFNYVFFAFLCKLKSYYARKNNKYSAENLHFQTAVMYFKNLFS